MAKILKIREVVGSLARNTVAKACKRFRSWIEDVVNVDGRLLNKWILSTFLCQPVFNLIKLMVFSCAVSFKKNIIGIPDLLLPPFCMCRTPDPVGGSAVRVR